MSRYVSSEAERVAEGIRLGGRGPQIDRAPGPLNVHDLETLTRPDACVEYFDRVAYGVDVGGWDVQGLLKMHRYDDGHYAIAAEWYGWLPGIYADREAALLAYGYVLGGEGAGPLDLLRDAAVRTDGKLISSDDLAAFAAAGAPGSSD